VFRRPAEVFLTRQLRGGAHQRQGREIVQEIAAVVGSIAAPVDIGGLEVTWPSPKHVLAAQVEHAGDEPAVAFADPGQGSQRLEGTIEDR
jgi:hypothetical protein